MAPAGRPDVFAPTTLGPVTLRNRTVKAATFEGRTACGLVTDELIDYHLAVARGGVGRQQTSKCIHCNRCLPTIYSGTHCPVIVEAPNEPLPHN